MDVVPAGVDFFVRQGGVRER